ncbi:hypothetical protein GCM10027080_39190 [Pedococcus soli]
MPSGVTTGTGVDASCAVGEALALPDANIAVASSAAEAANAAPASRRGRWVLWDMGMPPGVGGVVHRPCGSGLPALCPIGPAYGGLPALQSFTGPPGRGVRAT